MSDLAWAVSVVIWSIVITCLFMWAHNKDMEVKDKKIKELEHELWDKEKEIEKLKGED